MSPRFLLMSDTRFHLNWMYLNKNSRIHTASESVRRSSGDLFLHFSAFTLFFPIFR